MSHNLRELSPRELYLEDHRDRDGITWPAPLGKSHFISWHQRRTTGLGKGRDISAFYPQVYSSFTAWVRSEGVAISKEELIKKLRREIELLEEMDIPSERDIQGMPKIGEVVWAMAGDKPDSAPVKEIVLEHGEARVVLGWHIFGPGQWGWTKEEVEEQERQRRAGNGGSAGGKTVFGI